MAPNTAVLIEQSAGNDASDTVANEGAPADVTNQDNGIQVSFSHVHFYVDHVEDVNVYKQLEYSLHIGKNDGIPHTETEFCPQNRDIIKQLVCGFGFRVTGVRRNTPTTDTNTRSVLVTSKDPKGVQFIITSIDSASHVPQDDMSHFDKSKCVYTHLILGEHEQTHGTHYRIVVFRRKCHAVL